MPNTIFSYINLILNKVGWVLPKKVRSQLFARNTGTFRDRLILLIFGFTLTGTAIAT